jgi:hypothetical protein
MKVKIFPPGALFLGLAISGVMSGAALLIFLALFPH